MHVKPGKGAAFVRSKLKSCLTGHTLDKTWRAGETVQVAQVEKKNAEFTYVDGQDFVFMDMATYEEIRLPRDNSWAAFVTEGCKVMLVLWNGSVISVEPPTTVELTIAATEPGIRGNTVSGGTKPATLETGASIQVPLFVNIGDRIKVDSRSCTYIGRV
ncbi:hypothetical protein QBZ16_001594 [Prototheca wickerhamii]|uniref:Elongation factor P n=1 Tax=Prototheca wickerhamii TaxID=3111 RepID=A0AAD9IE96_PROWI|nr:hypothetical protein QBZ16_001594 [Prototheca wickerhamii]